MIWWVLYLHAGLYQPSEGWWAFSVHSPQECVALYNKLVNQWHDADYRSQWWCTAYRQTPNGPKPVGVWP